MALKRSLLKRKPMSRTKMPSKKKKRSRAKLTPLKKLKKELWELCKQIIRKLYGNTCYTCGAKNLEGGNWQTGHFIPRSICGLYLRFDLRNLRPQCYRCNISLSGNGAIFYRLLVRDCNQSYVDELFSDKNRITKETRVFYEDLIAKYKTTLQELEQV